MKPTILGNFFPVVGVILLVLGLTARPAQPHEQSEKQMQLAFGAGSLTLGALLRWGSK
jgi:hypothetical protein